MSKKSKKSKKNPKNVKNITDKKIAELAKNHLTKNGKLFFEINQYLGKEMIDLLQEHGFTTELKKDIFGNDRMTKSTL